MARFSLKKYGYLDSVKKVNLLITELKEKNVKLTAELKAQIVGKLQSKEALVCWRDRLNEFDIPHTNFGAANNMSPTDGQIKTKSKKKHGNRKKKSNILVNNGSKLNPNSANYDVELLKAGLKDKFKDYNYDLSDW